MQETGVGRLPGIASPTPQFMLELSNVSKSFAGRIVVDRVSARFLPDTRYVLIGPSGCGKSTILKMLIGLIQPDSGHVCVDDRPLQDADRSSTRQRFGYVIQSGGLFPHLTARQNIALPAAWNQYPPLRISRRIDELIDLTRFPADGLDRYPGQLSGGQRQRVGLMRALVLDPEFLLLDEPLGALDPMIRDRLQRELKTIFDTLHKTVVLVTHDLYEAARFADEIILLRNGQIRQRGTLHQLMDQPAEPFVNEFVRAQQHQLAGVANQPPGATE